MDGIKKNVEEKSLLRYISEALLTFPSNLTEGGIRYKSYVCPL